MFDLSSKYVIIDKVPPKKKKVDQAEKLKQKYKLGKYKYSLLNPDNFVFDSPKKIREKDFGEQLKGNFTLFSFFREDNSL